MIVVSVCCKSPGPYPRNDLYSSPYRDRLSSAGLEALGIWYGPEYEHNSQPNTLDNAPG